MKSFALLFLIAVGLAGAVPVRAQVEASLVSADRSIQPGHPVHVALHLVHQPHWHTYWKNPGTGLPTALAWSLPPGWSASDIEWPTPHLLSDTHGTPFGNGFDGDTLLPVTLTPPANLKPGDTVVLKASATWLMCMDSCVPGDAEVSLSLPVSAEAPAPDPAYAARIESLRKSLPRAVPGWSVSASKAGQTVKLTLTPTGSVTPPTRPHFFSLDALIDFDKPQTLATAANGSVTLTLSVGSDGPANPTRLVGVLASETSWQEGQDLPGFLIDVPFGSTPVGIQAPAPAAAPTSFLATLAIALIGGMILNLMPCVFPVIGIKILGFVKQAGSERSKVTLHGLVFASGVLLSFWVLAGILEVLRASGQNLGWGFQLQSPAFVFALASVMMVFALNMSGVFEFGLAATAVGSELQSKGGIAGSFFSGVLATVVATPCSAPFLAPALGAALALSPLEAFAIFTAIAIGLSAPYLVLSIFPEAVKVLPRPGAWMETFKQAMAFPLYGTVGYLIWVLAGQTQEAELLSVLFGLVLIAMGVWAYGRWNAPGASAGRARFGLVAGLILAALGAWMGWPKPAAPSDIVWEKWSPEAVQTLRSQGKTVYVDFTARWCATCQANKKLVFHDDAVLREFHTRGIVTLRGDWTNRDPAITAELAKYGRSAVPFNVVWLPGRDEPVILPELLNPSVVLKAVGAKQG